MEALNQAEWDRIASRAGTNEEVSKDGRVYLFCSLERMDHAKIDLFGGKSWLEQLRIEAPSHGAEAVVHCGHLYFVWPHAEG